MGAKEKLDVEHKSPCASRRKPLQLAHTTFPQGDVTYLQLEYPLGILDLHFLLGLRLRFTSRTRRGRCRARRGVALTGGSHVCIPGVDRRVEDTDDDSDGDGTNATVCFASDTDDMLGDGTDDNEVYDVSDLNGAIQDMEDEAANALAPPDIVGSSAAARIRAYYEALPEASAAQLVVDPVWLTRPSRFSCPPLRCALRFALTAGGSGLTERDQVRDANSLRLIEMDATRGTTVRDPIVRTFFSPRSFLTATRHEVNRMLAIRKWQRVHISIRNRTYDNYFGDAL